MSNYKVLLIFFVQSVASSTAEHMVEKLQSVSMNKYFMSHYQINNHTQ